MSNISDVSPGKTVTDFGECLLTTYPTRWTSSLLLTLVLKCIVASVISVSASTCNLLFIIAFRRTPSLHTIPNRLLSYLSMCDFLTSAVAMPLNVIRGILVLQSMPNCIFFNIERFFIFLLSPASFSLLFLISFERFLAVIFPLRYSRWCDEKRIKIWFATALFFNVLFWPIMLWDLTLYYAVFGVIVCVIVVQILSIYVVLYRTVRTQRRRIHAQSMCWRAEDRNENKTRVRFLEIHEVGMLDPRINSAVFQANQNSLAEDVKSTGKNLTGTGATEVNGTEVESTRTRETEAKLTGCDAMEAKSTGSNRTKKNWIKSDSAKMKSTGCYEAEVKSTQGSTSEKQSAGRQKVDLEFSKNFKWDVKESFIFTLRLGIEDRKEILIAEAKKLDVKETGSRVSEVEENGSSTPESVENYKMEVKDYKAEQTIAIILSVMIFCYLPAIVFVLYVLAAKASLYERHVFGTWFEILVLLNCLFNPCIYYWKNPAIRKAVINILPKCFRKISPEQH